MSLFLLSAEGFLLAKRHVLRRNSTLNNSQHPQDISRPYDGILVTCNDIKFAGSDFRFKNKLRDVHGLVHSEGPSQFQGHLVPAEQVFFCCY